MLYTTERNDMEMDKYNFNLLCVHNNQINNIVSEVKLSVD